MENTISWKSLPVWSDGEYIGTLGEMVSRFQVDDDTFSGLHFNTDGSIRQWPGNSAGVPAEEVDWSGLKESLTAIDPLFWL